MDKLHNPPQILFVPICNQCGQRIYETVGFHSCPDQCSKGVLYLRYEIEPATCPHCGALFEQIIMPTNPSFTKY